MKHVALATGIGGVLLAICGCSLPNRTAVASAVSRYELSMTRALAAAPTATADKTRTDAADENLTWLAATEQIAQAESAGAKDEGAALGYKPWRERRGPAYAGDFWRSVGRDAKEIPATLWDDTVATARNPLSLGLLAAAGVTGIVLSNSPDDRVERHFTRHGSQLNTFWDTVGDVGGNPGTHFAIAGAMYLTALAREDARTYEVSKTLINALALNGLVTLALKGAVRTESPNGDEFGWPSGHTSSAFTFATVMYEEYGPWVGVPLFAFASYVGYERIDARNHDFSDVISGALIGIAIGHAVAQNHQMRVLGMDVMPYVDPVRGGVGVALGKQW